MRIKVSDLKDEKLAEWVAMSQGWWTDGIGYVFADGSRDYLYDIKVKDYRPDINGGQCFDLIEEFGVHITEHNDPITGERTGWECETFPLDAEEYQLCRTQYGGKDELKVAICRAVIASVYGEYVDE